MTPGQLQVAYPSEYQSWKNSKNRCKKKGWPWADEWKTFNGFLLSMRPKPTPAHTLDRKDNSVGAYGPGLCRWADKPTQNNNKSDNIKIVVPLTNEVFTPQKLAKLHGVKVETVYKWKANFYSDLEMLAGKKSKPLHALSVALDELAASLPPKGKKLPVPFKIPEFSYPYNEWEHIDDDLDHYYTTGEERPTHYLAYKAEFDATVEWIKRYNAGLSVPPEPPQGKYYKPRIPPSYYAKEQPLKPKVPQTYHGYEDPGEDEDYAEDSAPHDDDYEDEDSAHGL
jgi:hypothetical protein